MKAKIPKKKRGLMPKNASKKETRGVHFIFLHQPLATPEGWKEDVSETVCARNSLSQDEQLVASRGPQLSERWQQQQGDETADTAVRPRRRGTTRPCPAAAGSLLAAGSCAARLLAKDRVSSTGCTGPIANHRAREEGGERNRSLWIN